MRKEYRIELYTLSATTSDFECVNNIRTRITGATCRRAHVLKQALMFYQDYRMFLCLACRRYDSMWLALDPYFERVVTRRMFLAFVRSSTAPGMLRLNMWGP